MKDMLLLADPILQDQMFKKSVILISKHQENTGASGLIINHPTAQTVGDLLPTEEFSPLKNIRVHLGGPVDQNNLTFAIFKTTEGSQLDYKTQVPAQRAIDSIHTPGILVKAFAGHSSWTPGQLEVEMEENSWITTSASSDILRQNHERSLWSEILRSLSPYHQILAEAPDDIFGN